MCLLMHYQANSNQARAYLSKFSKQLFQLSHPAWISKAVKSAGADRVRKLLALPSTARAAMMAPTYAFRARSVPSAWGVIGKGVTDRNT